MAQVKVYGLASVLAPSRAAVSDAVHAALVEGLGIPADKRFHRFFPLAPEDFVHPAGRSERYTIVEVLLFAGRSEQAKKKAYAALYRGFAALGTAAEDLEVVLIETPRVDWAIRGVPGDELALSYAVET
ncbi:tautomerase-like protein [Motilibacter peucedani]|uniref:Tautomerase-like protein n=1 Tax=Motilibacter peucedani TaxID=598650 RepID=A0A420XSG9_9ACTN|nr:tautomerase family protein [Motilibacter peucedani]RKS77814.1 tautomerase-like protein [Motilibacter peucedani]